MCHSNTVWQSGLMSLTATTNVQVPLKQSSSGATPLYSTRTSHSRWSACSRCSLVVTLQRIWSQCTLGICQHSCWITHLQIVAFCVITTSTLAVQISKLAVAPSHRRHGIGKRLLKVRPCRNHQDSLLRCTWAAMQSSPRLQPLTAVCLVPGTVGVCKRMLDCSLARSICS